MPLGQLAGLVREVARRTHVAGLHLEIARQPVAGGDRVADAPPRLRLFGFRGRHHHRDRLDVGFRIVVRPFQLGERPRPLPCPLDRHLPHVAGAHPVPRFGRHREMKPRRAQRPGAAGGHRGGAPQRIAAYLICLAHADEQDPLRLPGGGIEEARLVTLAFEITARDGPGDEPARRFVEVRERRGDVAALRQGDGEKGGLDLGEGGRGDGARDGLSGHAR